MVLGFIVYFLFEFIGRVGSREVRKRVFGSCC